MNGRVQQLTPAVTGVPRTKWCPTCKALTAVVVDVFGLFPSGLVRLATVTFCEICNDPDDPEAHRG